MRDERVLAKISRFTRHIRPREQIDAAFASGLRRREVAVVGDERSAVTAQHLFHDRMATGFDDEIERAVNLRPNVLSRDGDLSEPCGNIEKRQRLRCRLYYGRCFSHDSREFVEGGKLDAERALGRACDLGLEFAQLGRGETHLAGERLAMNERRVEGGGQQLVAVLRRHLDEISQDVVVADLERAHRRGLGCNEPAGRR